MSGARLSRAYMPAMLKRHWGRVVFLSLESGLNIPPDMIHYGFSKTALLAIARRLATRAARTGVTVNAVLPGPTLSEGVRDMLIHSLDVWPEYRVNESVSGDVVWFEVCGEASEPYRRRWIEGQDWDEK